jgi:hypothetical protein
MRDPPLSRERQTKKSPPSGGLFICNAVTPQR